MATAQAVRKLQHRRQNLNPGRGEMANSSDNLGIKITLEDLEKVAPVNSEPAAAPVIAAERSYGNIRNAAETQAVDTPETRGSILLQAWFYLAVAGFSGAFLAWAICEPSFIDDEQARGWGNIWLLPLM